MSSGSLGAGTIKRIHVDRRIVAQNRRTGANAPAITIQTSKGPIKARKVCVAGLARFVQADGVAVKPLGCGARIWCETKARVTYV